jgi:hypothetical protein
MAILHSAALWMDVPGASIHGKQVDLPPEMNKDELALYEDAILGLERCIAVLYDQAVIAADEYMKFVDGVEAKATGWESRSTLQLSCTRKGNHLDLKWTGIRWFGPKNNRQFIRVRIAINAETMTYARDRLKTFAKDWEIDEVAKTEKKLQSIRRKSKHIVKAIVNARNAIRVLKAQKGEEVEFEEESAD